MTGTGTGPAQQQLSGIRDRVHPWLRAHRDDIANLLLSFVGVSCVTGDEKAVQNVIGQAMRERGWNVDRWEATPEETEPWLAYVGEQDVYDERPNLVARVPGTGDGRSLMLQGHVDTVGIGDASLWSHAPFGERVGDRIYGRGACDMKGGVVSMMVARQALDALSVPLQGDVLLATSVGEEDGGLGALSTILRGYRADGVIVTEPSCRSLVTAQAGAVVFRIIVPGKAAHAAARNEGESAFDHFIPIYQELMAWEQERNDTLSHPRFDHLANKLPISVGLVQAGDWLATVPESLVAEGRLGFLPGETIEGMQRAMEARITAVARNDPWLREHPPVIEWLGGQTAAVELAPGHDLAQTVSRAHEAATGNAVALEGVTYGADMRLFADVGRMPTVIYGGGDVRLAHAADEYIELDEVVAAAETLALAIAGWCGYNPAAR